MSTSKSTPIRATQDVLPLADHSALKAVFRTIAQGAQRDIEEFFIGDADGLNVPTPSLYGDDTLSDDAITREPEGGTDDPDVCYGWRCRTAEAQRGVLMRKHLAEEAAVEQLKRELQAASEALKARRAEVVESVSRAPQSMERIRGQVESELHQYEVRHAFLRSELDAETKERQVLQSQYDAEEAKVLKQIESAEKQLEQMAQARRQVRLHLSSINRMKAAAGEGISEEQRRRNLLLEAGGLKRAAEEKECEELMQELQEMRASHELHESVARDHHNELRFEIDEWRKDEGNFEARLADIASEQQLHGQDLQSELAKFSRERDELKAMRATQEHMDFDQFGQKLALEFEEESHDRKAAEVAMAREAREYEAELYASRQDYFSLKAGIRDMDEKALDSWDTLGHVAGLSGTALAESLEAQLSVTEMLKGALAKAEEEIQRQVARRRDLDRRIESTATRQLRRAAACCLGPARAPSHQRALTDAKANYI